MVFFTLAGASLDIGVLAGTWQVALILFGVRLASIVVGSAVGGMLAGDPARFNRVGWMSFVTQAGIGLGLAEEIAGEFPTWGGSLSAVIVAIIVMNQVVGPPLFKWALHLVGEARSVDDVARDRDLSRAVIVGWDAQAIAVARQLTVHGWEVAVASRKVNAEEAVPGSPATLTPLSDLTTEGLRAAGADRADTLVGLLTDEENTHLVEMARASFPSAHLVVQIHDRDRAATLAGDGVVVIDPETAIVNLLDHLVRTPAATSLLLGEDPGQDVTDLQVGNVALRGVAVRDLHLPLDIRVLSIQRRGARLISHGHTRLAVGDQVTVVGSAASLREVAFLFES
ncbi:MAG: TrkA C-terminal domain-containing protein [Acidobacteriota bacterium]